MRIIGGKYRGAILANVGKGDVLAQLRPTADRVRENIFNLLINGGYGDLVKDAFVLDAFAGTGALGFEALSRGASCVLFIDDGVKACSLIRENINILSVQKYAKLSKRDVTKYIKNDEIKYNLIFLDPPYGKNLGEKALSVLLENGWLSDDVVCIWEENSQKKAPVGFSILDCRKYGDTWIHILEKQS